MDTLSYTFGSREYRYAMRRGDFWTKRGEELREFADSAEVDRRLELLEHARTAFRLAADFYERAAAEFGERD